MTSQTKLCILTDAHWATAYGGAEYQIKLLLDQLNADGQFDIDYLSHNKVPEQTFDYRIQQPAAPNALSKYGHFIATLPVYNALKQAAPNVIYQRVASAFTGIAAFYAQRHNCRLIWHVASDRDVAPAPLPPFWRKPHFHIEQWMTDYGIRRCDHIIVQKHEQAALLKQNYGIEADSVIPNFQPTPNEKPSKPSTPLRVVWVSNLKQLKQPELFLDLVDAIAPQVDAEFIMVGRPNNTPWGQQLHERIERTSAVTYLGEQTQAQVNDLLAKSHVLVNTSEYEGFPNTYIQAWMRCMPVVSLNVNPSEIITTHHVGAYSQTVEQMQNDLLNLLQDTSLREVQAENAYHYGHQYHSLNNAKAIVELLKNHENASK